MKIYVLIAVLLLVGSAHAATLTVCHSGCEYSSIQAAIDAASPGDTIEVQSGAYNEDVVINKDVQLIYIGTVSVRTLYTCGHEIKADAIVASVVLGSCGPDASQGKISGGTVTVAGKTVGGSNPSNIVNPSLSESTRSNKPLASTVSEQLLYSDNFSNRNSGWSSSDNTVGSASYDNGRYRIFVLQNGKLTYSSLYKVFTNFVLEVEAALENGLDRNEYGVILRRVDDDNFYTFTITGEGNYKFDKFKKGQWTTIIPKTHSDAIHTGKAANKIKADCKGEAFTLYANGIKLGECTDSSFASGNVGLVAGTHGQGGTQASFDNLKVWAL